MKTISGHSCFNGNEEHERRFYLNSYDSFFDLVTGNNLKRLLQQDNLLRSQATTQTPASRAKTTRLMKGRKSRDVGERRVKNMQCREKSAKS